MLDKLSLLKTRSPASTVAWSNSLEATLLAASDAANSQIVKEKYCKSYEGVVKIKRELLKASRWSSIICGAPAKTGKKRRRRFKLHLRWCRVNFERGEVVFCFFFSFVANIFA